MPRRRLIIACLCAIALLAGAAPGGGATHRRAVPQGFMGVMAEPDFFGDAAQIDRAMGQMAANGVESVRIPLYWAAVQPTRDGPYDFSRSDAMIGAALRHGLHPLVVVLQAPAWARVAPASLWSEPSDVAAYTRLLSAAVARYAPFGVHDWQVWNEPNGPFFWNDGFDRRHRPILAPFAHYETLLRASHDAIKAADPNARVVLAGLIPASYVHGVAGSTKSLLRLYADGLGPDFDVVTLHPYTGKVAGVLLLLRQLRAAMRAHGDAAKPLWVTELSWPSAAGRLSRGSYLGFEVSEAGQASKLRSAYTALSRARVSLGLGQVFWYSWSSPDRGRTYAFSYSGLLRYRPRRASQPKPALAAYRRAAQQLEGCVKTSVATRCRGGSSAAAHRAR